MSSDTAERSLLTELRVLEAGDGFGVRYAGRLLALLGAQVTRIQPEPTIFDGYFNDAKQVVAGTPDAASLTAQAASVDVVIEGLPQAEYEKLAAAGLPAIHVSISPGGRSGPGVEAGRLAGLAFTGWMASEGEADGPPMGPGVPLAEYAAGLFAAIAATVAAACPTGTRPIMRFDISEAEALLRTMHSVTSVFSHTGVSQQRAGTAPVGLAQLDDGWLGIHALSADQVERLMAFLNIFAGLDTSGMATTADLSRAEVEAGLRANGHSAADLLRQGQEDFRLPFGLALTVPQLIKCEHLRQRDALRGSDEEGWYPARPFRMTETNSGEPRTRPAPTDGQILRGVKVVDLTMWFAGPIATQLLAELGADVVKIESPTHLDGYRLAAPTPGGQIWNRSPLHNTYSRGKRGLAVDLRTEEGREVVRRMIADADLVIENFSPGVMDRLGLSDEQIFALNPSIIIASLPGFGFSGPWGGFTGFAFNIEEFAGWTALSGYEGQVPLCSRLGSADPTSGLHAALILIAALTHPSGGRRIELSQQEALMELVGPAFSFYQAHGRVPERTGGLVGIDGRVTRLFQASGENQWVAADFADEEAAREAGARMAREHGTNGGGEWSRHLDRKALLAALREAGIAAYPVYEGRDAAEAEVFLARGAFEDLEHPLTGVRRYPRSPLAINGWPTFEGMPAPLLGQHNAEVLAELGYTPEEIADLTARGIAGDQPDRQRYAAAWAIA